VRLYLASTSPARKASLRAAGITPTVIASGVDEDAAVAVAGALPGVEMVLLLARLKAEAVAGRPHDGEPIDGFILGCDSAFELDGVVYGKPLTAKVARERWLLQRGREGTLHSGHWLIDHRGGTANGGIGAVSSAVVRFSDSIDEAEIDAYIATGEPLEVAGAFTIDARGSAFISEVRGDPHTVVGISIATLRDLLRQFDVSWPAMWNR
jgi:septum formation protein